MNGCPNCEIEKIKDSIPYTCEICNRLIVKEAHGGDRPSAGDHDSGEHVIRAYKTK